MKIELPKKVLFIINNLQLAGYDAFAVGGCVRDSILARKPQDWDITTSAKPEAIKEIFRRTVDTGIEHGTVQSANKFFNMMASLATLTSSSGKAFLISSKV